LIFTFFQNFFQF